MSSEDLEIERVLGDFDGGGVLHLKGPLNFETATDFQTAMRRESAPTMILDLSEVPYIDSAGLGSLVSVYISRHKSGQRMVLSGANARISNVLQITKMDRFFLIFPSPQEAIDALSNPGHA
jgi:anti-sigma B factor antagonist